MNSAEFAQAVFANFSPVLVIICHFSRGGGSRPRKIIVTHVTGPSLHAAMLLPCA